MTGALVFLGSIVGTFGGAFFASKLARRNTRLAESDRLLCEAVNDAVAAISDVAALNRHGRTHVDPVASMQAQARYGSAMSRVAIHASPEVIEAFAKFQRNADTGTAAGRKSLIDATNAARRSMGRADAPEEALSTLHFGASELESTA
ncbi:MAG: hypothetical protein ACPGWS_03625 [Solirubrobacterales bacterium]